MDRGLGEHPSIRCLHRQSGCLPTSSDELQLGEPFLSSLFDVAFHFQTRWTSGRGAINAGRGEQLGSAGSHETCTFTTGWRSILLFQIKYEVHF